MRCRLAATGILIAAASLLAHDPITTKVTWDREIAPIVKARCVSCHSPGGRAPMPLTTYAEVRPWARAIREEVLTRRMPLWHVVRGYGDFTNDPSLSPFEIALIVSWVDGGAPPFAKASTFAKAPVDKTGGKSVDTLLAPSAARSIVCISQALPAGRLVALTPALAPGASLKLTVRSPDGSEEALLWVRNFDPAFPETYRLRNPRLMTGSTWLHVAAGAGPANRCSIWLHYTA